LQDRLEEITAAVVRREEVRVKDGPLRLVTYTLFPLATALYRATGFFGLAKRFYADEACRGCGQCVRVCLAGRITLADGRPRWDPAKPCLYCLACLHYCPAAAIQLKRTRSTRRGRYHHPAVSAEQIAAQRGSTTAD
jgi:ferredoxin